MQPLDHELAPYLAESGLVYTPDCIFDFVCLELSRDEGYNNFSKGLDSNYPGIGYTPAQIGVSPGASEIFSKAVFSLIN